MAGKQKRRPARRLKLSQANISGFTYEGKALANGGMSRDFRWDTEIPGLAARIYPSGKKVFVFSYRANGRKRLMRIGRCSTMTIAMARERAKKLDVAVSDDKDPLEDRQRKRTAGKFRDLVDSYIEGQKAGKAKTWKKTKKQLDNHIPSGWWGRPAGSIYASDITALHARVGKTAPYMANRIIETLCAMYRHAPRWGFDVSKNPAEDVKKFHEVKRKRFVTEEEFPALALAIDMEPNIYIRAALWLYLLTGARKSELLQARWGQVDFERRILNLPETKSGEAQAISLSKPAIAILQATPREEGNPHIFPGQKTGKHLVNIGKSWTRIRKVATVRRWTEHTDQLVSGLIERLTLVLKREPTYEECLAAAQKEDGLDLPVGLVDARLHDLRRTVGSWLSRDNVDLNQIKEALRHASISTTLTYARLGEDPAREAMESHGERIMEVAGNVRPVNGGGI